MSVLEREAAEALRALAAARSPDPGAAERAWAAMQRRLVDGPPPRDIEPVPVRRRALTFAAAFAVAAAILVAVGLASWRGGWLAARDLRADDQAPYTSEPSAPIEPSPQAVLVPAIEPRVAPAPSNESTEVVAPSDAPEQPAASEGRRVEPKRRVTPRPSTEPEPKEPAATESTLAAELRLLSRANAAMRAGRYADALDVLAQHAREFEAGQLAPEREYKRALALCELGRGEQARAAADAFVREHPRSPLRAKAMDVCREGEP
jgi:type IV secretory pathway VirB10-like protein